jgi:hypothetical protein
MDPMNGGLMAINLSDSEDDTAKTEEHPRARKTAQSEEAWQAVKADYTAKVENGEVSPCQSACCDRNFQVRY